MLLQAAAELEPPAAGRVASEAAACQRAKTW
jgi:hypothetical protein